MKNIGGYILIDCGGLDLTSESSQTINGLYAQLTDAIASGKPVYAENLYWGDIPCSPTPVMLVQLYEDTITATASTLQVSTDDDDAVTILNMAPST